MNVIAHGIDIVDCERLAQSIERYGDRFCQRVFTEHELAYCAGRKRRIEHLAGRFAAKEAVFKTLGTGWRNGISWLDVEVRNEPSGQPRVVLTGTCQALARQRGFAELLLSISHVTSHAVASVIAVGPAAPADDGANPIA